MKSVRIRSFSGPYFPAVGLNMDKYGVSLRIQSEWGTKTDQKNYEYRHFSRWFFFIEKKLREWYVDKEETIWSEKLWLLEKKIATNLFGLTDGSHLDNTVD